MFEKAIALDPKYAEAYALLGGNYFIGWILAFNAGSRDGLERACKNGTTSDCSRRSSATAHSMMAYIDASTGQFERAEAEAQRAIALDPNYAEAYAAMALVLNSQTKPAEALVAVDKAMRLDPRNPEYLWEQGRAYSLLGRWKESILALKPYLGRHPDHLWAHAYLAFDYSFLGEEDAARAETAEVERAAALNPNSTIGYAALAQALNSLGRPTEALAAIDKAMRLDPKGADFDTFQQGWAYTLLGSSKEAMPLSILPSSLSR